MLEICEYQAVWPERFELVALKLRRALGELALRIDHIGSTAVPGLASKDLLDVQITVAELAPDVERLLGEAGYRRIAAVESDHRPPADHGTDADWQKWFFRLADAERDANIHVRVRGRMNQYYALLFRDYLRKHPATAAAYAELKRRLVRELRNPAAYPDVKDPAVDLIYLAADAWAKTIDWRCGPSDA